VPALLVTESVSPSGDPVVKNPSDAEKMALDVVATQYVASDPATVKFEPPVNV
jgi:hypothetical protein